METPAAPRTDSRPRRRRVFFFSGPTDDGRATGFVSTPSNPQVTADQVLGYHVHVAFLSNNNASTRAARRLGDAFEARFEEVGATVECPRGPRAVPDVDY